MVWTLDRTTGVDRTYVTETVVGPTAGSRIYSPGGVSPIADINISGKTWLTVPAASLSTLNGDGASDRLVTGSTDDLVIWDTGGLHDLIFDDLTVLGRARLPSASANARIERFDLGNGQDFINLTANATNLPTGNSPGTYNWAVTVYGGDGNDVIASGEAGDVLVGDDNSGLPPTDVRSDTIWGFGGNDTIFGDDGSIDPATTVGLADTLFGGTGNDIIYGEGGDDTIWGESGTDTLYGAAGNDLIYGEDPVSADVIGSPADTIYAGAGNDTVYGGFGGDTLFGEAGGDRLFGDDGDDTVDAGGGLDTVYGGLGNDSIEGGNGSDILYGDGVTETVSDGNDTLSGGDNSDTLYGGGGNDVLRGGTSNVPFNIDSLFGGSGDDIMQFDAGENADVDGAIRAWDGFSANATTIAFSGGANISGDRFFGGAGTDTLALNNGTDVFTVWSGDVKTSSLNYGGAGNQRLTGVELIIAGGGTDYIMMNHLSTGGGDPSQVWTDNITIAGMAQADTIFSGSGNDVIWGDIVGNGTGAPGDGDDFLVGGAGNDTIIGAGGIDLLFGGTGNDTIDGGDGNDTIYGGGGQDSLIGNGGNDLIFGGNGNVTSEDGGDVIVMSYSSPFGDFTINTGKNSVDPQDDGADSVYVSGRYNSVTANLGGQDDRYIASSTDTGPAQIDRVDGELGNDLISTWYGNDEISGSEGTDALWGGAGSDTIYGGPGTDYLYGGFGDNDVLNGGAGTDYYYYSRTDGQGDQIFDDFRGTAVLPGQQADNVLVVFPDFDPTEVNGDGLRTGSGVFEVDHDLNDLAGGNDMVQLTDIDGAGGTMWRMTILTGDGATNYVEFDQRDVQTILLWNNDAAPGTNVIQTYAWDPVDGRYEFIS